MTEKNAHQRAQETTDPNKRKFLMRGIDEHEERHRRDPEQNLYPKGR